MPPSGDGLGQLKTLRRALEASEQPSYANLRDYLAEASDCRALAELGALREQQGAWAHARSARVPLGHGDGLLPHCRRCRTPPPTCCLPTLCFEQVRELRLRDPERIVKYGTELLSRHSRRLDPEERESEPSAVAVAAAPSSHRR